MVRNNRQIRFIEAEGFYHGVHFAPPAPAESEIESRFTRETHQVRHDSVDESKALEATIALLESREPDATEHWVRLRDETQGQAPEIAMPLFAIKTSLLAVAGETLLLAPVMDGFGIANAVWQAVTAATLVIVASGLLHLALRRVQELVRNDGVKEGHHRGPAAAAMTIAIALFALATITVLGWWRAGEMIFAANAQGGDWARFLGDSAVLTKICVTLLTLGLPLFAAAAFDWGFERLRYAIEWRRARRLYNRLTESLESARKRLQAVTEKRDHRIKALIEEKGAWCHAYRENYELGLRMGARRLSVWRVILHIAAMILVLAACCAAIESFFTSPITTPRLFCYLCLTLGLGGLYAHLALKAWERPTPLQLYRQRPVIWRNPGISIVEGPHDHGTTPLNERTNQLVPRGRL